MEIGELAAAAGVTRRTIRYYVARGLLPPGEEAGRGRLFGRTHLLRLRMIRQLKDKFLPLEEISKRLSVMTERDLEREAGGADIMPIMQSLREERIRYEPSICRSPPVSAPLSAPQSAPEDDKWIRHILIPGVELHVRESNALAASSLVSQILLVARKRRGYFDPELDTPDTDA